MNGEKIGTLLKFLLAISALALTATAQVQSNTSTSAGAPNVQTSVERGEVVRVSGNDVVVKMEDGTIRDFANVPDDARVTVDGKEISIHELQPGMKLEKTLTTTTTPKTITTVETVTGTVFSVHPPVSVILTLENGQNQQFKIPKDQKFNVDGQMVDAFALKKGMKVTATKVVETPTSEVEQQAKVTGQMPPTTEALAADAPMLVAEAKPVPPPSAASTAAPSTAALSKLPNTGSELPLIALLGTLSVSWGVKRLRSLRRSGRV
jgi:hypothetical protein